MAALYAEGASRAVPPAIAISTQHRHRRGSHVSHQKASRPTAHRHQTGPAPRPSMHGWSCAYPIHVDRAGVRRVDSAAAAAAAAGGGDGIGLDGLKAFLGEASQSLGHCRFIVANTASGGILEAVQDFGIAPLRYSQPTERGQFATLGTDAFECHLNVHKIRQIVFASKERPQQEEDTTPRSPMYIIRFLDEGGASALSVVLHCGNGTDYTANGSGRPAGWEQLKAKYGDAVDI